MAGRDPLRRSPGGGPVHRRPGRHRARRRTWRGDSETSWRRSARRLRNDSGDGGDGVNDAAALAAATVGSASTVGRGGPGRRRCVSRSARSRAGVDLLRGSRRTLGVIRRNLVFSLTYNVVAVTFAITGHMSPLLAAILMPLSSMTVVLSSYRAKTFLE